MYNCIKGIYKGNNILVRESGEIVLLSFYGIMKDEQYINRTIFVRGEFFGTTFMVKEVI